MEGQQQSSPPQGKKTQVIVSFSVIGFFFVLGIIFIAVGAAVWICPAGCVKQSCSINGFTYQCNCGFFCSTGVYYLLPLAYVGAVMLIASCVAAGVIGFLTHRRGWWA